MRYLKYMVVLLILTGCASDPLKESKTNNSNIKVSLIFEHDGCRVYRFMDAMEYVYYANCDGSRTVDTTWGVQEGKVHVMKSMVTSE